MERQVASESMHRGNGRKPEPEGLGDAELRQLKDDIDDLRHEYNKRRAKYAETENRMEATLWEPTEKNCRARENLLGILDDLKSMSEEILPRPHNDNYFSQLFDSLIERVGTDIYKGPATTHAWSTRRAAVGWRGGFPSAGVVA